MKISTKVRMAAQTAMTALLLMVGAMPAVAYDRSHYAESSKLASGTWVKIQVTESGMHEITADDAQSWGLGSLDRVRVFGYGGAMLSESLSESDLDDLPQVPTVRTGNRLVFYAQGPVVRQAGSQGMTFIQQHNPYSDAGYYFVTNDERYGEVAAEQSTTPVSEATPETTFIETTYHEVDLVNAGQTGRMFLGEDFRYNTRQTFNFDLKGLVAGSTVKVRTVLCAKLMRATSRIECQYNGTSLPSDSYDNIAQCTSTNHDHFRSCTSTKSFTLPEGSTSLAYTVSYPSGGSAAMARLDYITVNYTRALNLDGKELAFSIADDVAALQVGGCGAGTHIWDVTAPSAPVEMNTTGDATRTFSPIAIGRRDYVAWNEDASFPRPTLAEKLTAQDIHAQPTPDMIILAPSEYLTAAQRLASMHESHDGMRVLVLDHRKVFNEFSSGTPDFMAYRRLCKMFHDRGTDENAHRLGYLLLLGGGSYDNRLITATVRETAGPMLLTWQSETSQREETSYTTDDILAVLADDCDATYYRYDMDIAVGRMPARSVSEASTLVDKAIKYATQADYGAWKTGVLDVADDGDSGEHMIQEQRQITESLAAGGESMVHNFVYLDAFTAESQGGGRYYPDARNKLYNTLSEGVLWWTYVGHAGPDALATEGLLRADDAQNRCYYRHLPVFYGATCEFTRFDQNITSTGVQLLLNSNGGIIASICPARLVYVNWNGELTRHMGKVMFARDEAGRGQRIGDIARLAKNSLRAELEERRSSSDNHSRYMMLGDPALRLALPRMQATVDAYNGQAVDSDNKPTFEARQTIKVSGSVRKSDGTVATGFNGRVIATLRDSEQSVTTHGYGDEGLEYTYLDRPNKLAIVTDTVRGGNFEFNVTIPTEILDNYSPAMINLYAYDQSSADEAMGSDDNFYIYGVDDDAAIDNEGPVIHYFGLNGGSFSDGDNVNESPLVIAQVSDESGLNFSTSGVGHAMTLTLDGTTTYTDLQSFYTPTITDKGSAGTINYSLSDLAYGEHTLRLRVWDVFNNSSEQTIRFNVMQGLKPSIVDVYAVGNPASVETRFYVTHNRPDAVMTVTIEVYDLMGRRLWSTTQTGRSDMFTTTPVTWNLSDYTGRRVPRGIYVYRATITADGVREASKAKRIAVTGE